ncbi:MAG TPA: hypothetical protein VMU90_05470 [Solirubrobacteraceae bacterium]|nr:hypothetical protein [Solirubrobacteraceae bacterium]
MPPTSKSPDRTPVVDQTATVRRRVGAASIVAFFVALLGSAIVEPTDSHTNADQLKAAIAHPGAMQGAAWLNIAAGILAPLAVLTLMHVVRGRGRRLAHIGGALGIIGAPGMTLIGIHQMFIVALAQKANGNAAAVVNRLDHLAPAVMILVWALPVAFVVLAGAIVRARLASPVLLVAAVVFFLLDSVPLPAAEVIQQILGLATFGWIARRILAISDEQWTDPDSRAAATPAASVTAPAAT